MTDHDTRILARDLGVSLTVNDIDASLAFYRDVIGFDVAETFEREGTVFAISLRAGEVRILLTRDDGSRGEGRTKGEGFSMQLTTTQDVDALANAIVARGGTLEGEPATMRWGQRFFRFRDPDGFRFTVSSPRP